MTTFPTAPRRRRARAGCLFAALLAAASGRWWTVGAARVRRVR